MNHKKTKTKQTRATPSSFGPHVTSRFEQKPAVYSAPVVCHGGCCRQEGHLRSWLTRRLWTTALTSVSWSNRHVAQDVALQEAEALRNAISNGPITLKSMGTPVDISARLPFDARTHGHSTCPAVPRGEIEVEAWLRSVWWSGDVMLQSHA